MNGAGPRCALREGDRAWTFDQLVQYSDDNLLPVNPLLSQGYPSIGCQPCTRAVRPGESERAGRWWWETDVPSECGLHLGADGRLVRTRVAA